MSKKTNSGFLSGKGFYVALAVCLIGAGSAAWVAVDRTLNSIDMAQPKQEQPADFFTPEVEKETENQAVESPVKELPKKAAEKSSSAPAAGSSSSQQPATSSPEQQESGARQVLSPTQSVSGFCLPINSEITKTFSGKDLVKNTTLNTWRVHSGIDIKAKEGDPVVSAFAGQITKVYGDAMWGNVVEVTGKANDVAVYSGLSDGMTIAVGDVVAMGQSIGTVGKVPCESADGAHLHFAIQSKGQYVNPMTFAGGEAAK